MIYLLPFLAVLLSFGFVCIFRPKKKEHFRLLLAFSGAFLLALTIFELLPQAYEQADSKQVGIFIMAGIFLQIFLEFFSKGAEHGHVHIGSETKEIPILLGISLCVHALLEGIPIANNTTIIYGIIIHKIPISIILSIFLFGSQMNRKAIFCYMLVFALMTPLGTYLAQHIPLFTTYAVYINALVIGVFLHIATVILFESSEGHTFNLRKLAVIFAGILLAYFL